MDILDPGPPAAPAAAGDFARLAAELGALKRLLAPDPVPFARFRDDLLALYAPPLRAPSTFYHMRQVLGMLEALGVRTTADLTPGLVARFVRSRQETGESPNNTHSLLAYVRVACNWAAAEGLVRVSPFANRKSWVRRVSPAVPRVHSREEIARVLARARAEVGRKRGHRQAGPWAEWRAHRLLALVATVAYTGLRKSEALRLRVEDVLWDERMILVRSRRDRGTKTEAAAQPVPMPAALVEVLRGWLPNLAVPEDLPPRRGPSPASNPGGTPDPGWLFPNASRTGPWEGGTPGHKPVDKLKNLGRRAGVEGFTFQSLRHSWATHAEYWGLTDLQIQRVLRHTNTRTQRHYRHAEAANLRALVGRVGFGHDQAGAESSAEGLLSPAAAPPPAGAGGPRRDAGPDPRACGPKLGGGAAAELRALRAEGWGYKALAARFGVSKSTVHYCLYGATWRPVPPPG